MDEKTLLWNIKYIRTITTSTKKSSIIILA